MATSIEDLVFRRTSLAIHGQLSSPLLKRLAELLEDEVGIQTDLPTVQHRLMEINGVPGLD